MCHYVAGKLVKNCPMKRNATSLWQNYTPAITGRKTSHLGWWKVSDTRWLHSLGLVACLYVFVPLFPSLSQTRILWNIWNHRQMPLQTEYLRRLEIVVPFLSLRNDPECLFPDQVKTALQTKIPQWPRPTIWWRILCTTSLYFFS